jgi:hypothetical protein
MLRCVPSSYYDISTTPIGNIVDLSYLVLCCDWDLYATRQDTIRSYSRFELHDDDFTTSYRHYMDPGPTITSKLYTRPPVAAYFLEKWPRNDWTSLLVTDLEQRRK